MPDTNKEKHCKSVFKIGDCVETYSGHTLFLVVGKQYVSSSYLETDITPCLFYWLDIEYWSTVAKDNMPVLLGAVQRIPTKTLRLNRQSKKVLDVVKHTVETK